MGARDVAQELAQTVPDSPRPAQLFGEISTPRGDRPQAQGIEQGVHQLEIFLDQRKVGEAEMALQDRGADGARPPAAARSFEQRVRALRLGGR